MSIEDKEFLCILANEKRVYHLNHLRSFSTFISHSFMNSQYMPGYMTMIEYSLRLGCQKICGTISHMHLAPYFLDTPYHRNISQSYNQMQGEETNKSALFFMMLEQLIVEYNLYETSKIVSYFRVPMDMAMQRIEMLINRSRTNKLIGLEKMWKKASIQLIKKVRIEFVSINTIEIASARHYPRILKR